VGTKIKAKKMALMAALRLCSSTFSNGLNGSDKALSTPAFGALIDVMHEARLIRFGFGAGKAHLGAAFHARRVYVETLGLALWHCPPLDKANGTGELRFHDSKDVATNQNLPCTR
jgi:hypothetical protein